MNIQELEQKINEANKAYRQGEEILTDVQYDSLLEELEVLDPDNELLNKIGLEVSDDRKERLPIDMASMNKVKTFDEILKWFRSKGIPQSSLLTLTPKYDGASFCVKESTKQGWTRGNGVEGQRSDSHLSKMNTDTINDDIITFGEVIMKRSVFESKYSEDFSNPRNLVAGQLNHKTPNDILTDVDLIRYGLVGKEFKTKSEELKYLNSNQKIKVPFKTLTVDGISEEYLKDLFIEWSKEYEIDGIIIEVDDVELRKKLGREVSSNNPCFARAFKGNFEEVKETIVENITWHISKNGLLKPVMNVKSINLDGVNVTNVTGNNAKFLKDLNIGVGSKITVKRSGMVIPKLVEVIESTGFELPIIDGVEIGWNDNGVELITESVTNEQRFKQLVSFFTILEVENLGEGIIKQFFDAGFDTPTKVLKMTKEDMMGLDKFGVRKAKKVIDSINEKRNVTLSKLQHSSGFFTNLGSKKLVLLEDLDETATIDKIIEREGFSEISAKSYLDGIVKFNEWVKELDGLITISKTEKKVSSSNSLESMNFVFTGVRRKDLESIITDNGGVIGSSVSKKTTHLIMKQKGSGSSKEKKALSLGVTIMEVEELETMLNNL